MHCSAWFSKAALADSLESQSVVRAIAAFALCSRSFELLVLTCYDDIVASAGGAAWHVEKWNTFPYSTNTAFVCPCFPFLSVAWFNRLKWPSYHNRETLPSQSAKLQISTWTLGSQNTSKTEDRCLISIYSWFCFPPFYITIFPPCNSSRWKLCFAIAGES